MTRIEVGLELPEDAAGDASGTLRLPAVVVRCEPHPTVGANWSLALFFAPLEAAARERLAGYLRQRRTMSADVAGKSGDS